MSFTDWPGAGPVPEEEPEGFRQEQVEQEKERIAQKEVDRVQSSKELKDQLSGNQADGEEVEPPVDPGTEPEPEPAPEEDDENITVDQPGTQTGTPTP